MENRLLLILKFGKKEDLEKLRNGDVYAKNAKYYIGYEEDNEDKSRGDRYEFSQTFVECKGILIDKTTNKPIINFEGGTVQIRDIEFEKTPIFCACGITLNDFNLISEDDINFTFELNFKEVFGDTFNESYWDSVALLSAGEFADRLKTSAEKNKVSFVQRMVKYYNHFNLIDKEIEVENDFANIAFWKQSIYKNQKELRILFNNQKVEGNNGYILNIGSLSDICTIISREQIEDTVFHFKFKKIKQYIASE